jgi:hypothetical protein
MIISFLELVVGWVLGLTRLGVFGLRLGRQRHSLRSYPADSLRSPLTAAPSTKGGLVIG